MRSSKAIVVAIIIGLAEFVYAIHKENLAFAISTFVFIVGGSLNLALLK